MIIEMEIEEVKKLFASASEEKFELKEVSLIDGETMALALLQLGVNL